jgi:hypothetical protein
LYVKAQHDLLGEYMLACEGADDLLFTENETNAARLFGTANGTPYVKDAFHEYVIHGRSAAVNPDRRGTKAAALYRRTAAPGEAITVRLRLHRTRRAEALRREASGAAPSNLSAPSMSRLEHEALAMAARSGVPVPTQNGQPPHDSFAEFEQILAKRKEEADEFYTALQPEGLGEDERRVQRQAFAGLLWSKQFYHYDVNQWLQGDPAQPPPPASRLFGRNRQWRHFNSADVLSMPDKWEYPWFAAWDLAFHCIAFAQIDSRFAKDQLLLLLRE